MSSFVRHYLKALSSSLLGTVEERVEEETIPGKEAADETVFFECDQDNVEVPNDNFFDCDVTDPNRLSELTIK